MLRGTVLAIMTTLAYSFPFSESSHGQTNPMDYFSLHGNSESEQLPVNLGDESLLKNPQVDPPDSGIMSQSDKRADLFGSSFERRIFSPFNRLLFSLLGPRLMRFQMDMMIQAVMSEVIRKMIGPVISAVTSRVVNPGDSQAKGLINLGLGGQVGGQGSAPQIQVIPSHSSTGQIQLIIRPSADSPGTSLALGQPNVATSQAQNLAIQLPQTADSQLQQHLNQQLQQQLLNQFPAQVVPQVQQQIQSQKQEQLQTQVRLHLLQQLQQQMLAQNGNQQIASNSPNNLASLQFQANHQHSLNTLQGNAQSSNINDAQKLSLASKSPFNLDPSGPLSRDPRVSPMQTQLKLQASSGSSFVPNVQLVGLPPDSQSATGQPIIIPEVKFAMPYKPANGQGMTSNLGLSTSFASTDFSGPQEMKNSTFVTAPENYKNFGFPLGFSPPATENNPQAPDSENFSQADSYGMRNIDSSQPEASPDLASEPAPANASSSPEVASYENIKEIIQQSKDGAVNNNRPASSESERVADQSNPAAGESRHYDSKGDPESNGEYATSDNQMLLNHQHGSPEEPSPPSDEAASESQPDHSIVPVPHVRSGPELAWEVAPMQYHDSDNEYSSYLGFTQDQEGERKKRWKAVLQNLDKYYGIK